MEESNYYPFGLKHKGYNNVITGRDHKWEFQGQETQDELGLNWSSFKWRNHDPALGRFFGIDPLAEKYNYQSPYAFAENKVISHIELEGLEGIHHTKVNKAGNTSHVIEKNTVILTQKKLKMPKNASERQARRVNRKNSQIVSKNNSRVSKIKGELKKFYGGNYQNNEGESVTFKINVSISAVDDTDGGSTIEGVNKHMYTANKGIISGEKHLDGKRDKISPAAVFTTHETNGAVGSTRGNLIDTIMGSMDGTAAHEFVHTLGLDDNGYTKGGVLNSPPESLSRDEVSNIIKNAFKPKK